MNQFKNIGIVLALLVIVIFLAAFKPSEKEILRIKITNVKVNSGDVIVEIYDNKSNWLKTPFRKISLASTQNVVNASFEIPFGKYAVTIYQDQNKNGETDMNFLGIPKELVGFGNNYKPFGEPKFKSALIEFGKTSTAHEIKLYKVL